MKHYQINLTEKAKTELAQIDQGKYPTIHKLLTYLTTPHRDQLVSTSLDSQYLSANLAITFKHSKIHNAEYFAAIFLALNYLSFTRVYYIPRAEQTHSA